MLLGIAVLACATAVALLMTQLLLSPPRSDLVELGTDLTVSGSLTLILGALLIRFLEARLGLSLVARMALVTLVGSTVLAANIVVLARLMFISTDHDLQVLLATVVFSTVVAVFFTTWTASQTLARLSTINRSIRDLATGNLLIEGEVGGSDEVAMLARDVNALLSAWRSRGTSVRRSMRSVGS